MKQLAIKIEKLTLKNLKPQQDCPYSRHFYRIFKSLTNNYGLFRSWNVTGQKYSPCARNRDTCSHFAQIFHSERLKPRYSRKQNNGKCRNINYKCGRLRFVYSQSGKFSNGSNALEHTCAIEHNYRKLQRSIHV